MKLVEIAPETHDVASLMKQAAANVKSALRPAKLHGGEGGSRINKDGSRTLEFQTDKLPSYFTFADPNPGKVGYTDVSAFIRQRFNAKLKSVDVTTWTDPQTGVMIVLGGSQTKTFQPRSGHHYDPTKQTSTYDESKTIPFEVVYVHLRPDSAWLRSLPSKEDLSAQIKKLNGALNMYGQAIQSIDRRLDNNAVVSYCSQLLAAEQDLVLKNKSFEERFEGIFSFWGPQAKNQQLQRYFKAATDVVRRRRALKQAKKMAS